MSRNAGKISAFISFIFVHHASFAAVPDQLLETPLALAFGAPPTIGDPMLSPDGTQLLFTQQNPLGVTMLRSLNIADGAFITLLQGTEEGYDILWCEFANESRVLCDLREGLPQQNPDYQKFVAVNSDGAELQPMQERTGCLAYDDLGNRPQIDWAPDDPEQVLLLCGGTVTSLDIYSSRISDVSGAGEVGTGAGSGGCYVWKIHAVMGPLIACDDPVETGSLGRGQRLYANGHGLANMYSGHHAIRDKWFVRAGVADVWQEFLRTNPLQFESPFRPVGYGTNLNHVFNIGWDRETETWSLYRRELSADGANQLVYAHGTVDVQFVDSMGRHDRVVSAAFLDGRSQRAIVDPRVAEVYQFLSAKLPELEIEIVDESWDQNRYLARARPPTGAGEYLLVDMESEAIHVLGPEYDHLTGYALAETTLVQIESTTSGTITAHLTLPAGVQAPVPAVIIPRSLPTHEDIADPHYLVQFLAASGYAVLRVQNRVDEAYGRGWLEDRAIIGWNQSADDINDAAGFLVENGISEPGKVCTAGKDYGAYVSFMSAIKYPDVFSCTISIAGVADPRETPGAPIITATASSAEDNRLNAASPIRRASELNTPVLMFHGEADADFSITEHSVTLATVLERSDKDVTFIQYPHANHQIKRGPYRVDMLARIGGFLAEHIGPASAD